MGTIYFTHQTAGKLHIDNGINSAEWGYGLNTANFPTYAGEVVQILSVYVDDLTLTGTVATYAQMEDIYSFFAKYMLTASQTGRYDPYPVYVSYPERDWNFKIYPKQVPGFRYGREVVAPTWTMNAHVIDDTPDLDLIKDGLKALTLDKTAKLPYGDTFALVGEISPQWGNPDTDPWQTFTQPIAQQQQVIQKYSDYFNSLIPAYEAGQFGAITAGIGSKPTMPDPGTGGTQVQTGSAGSGAAGATGGAGGSSSSTPHDAEYQQAYTTMYKTMYNQYTNFGGCSALSSITDYQSNFVGPNNSTSVNQGKVDAVNAFLRAPYKCQFTPWSMP